MIVRRSQAVIIAAILGAMCVALVVAVTLAEPTSRPAIGLLGVAGLIGAAGLLIMARRRGVHAETILRNTLDSVAQGIATFSRGRIVASNAAFADLLALSPPEIAAGRTVDDIERGEKAKPTSVLDDVATQAKRAAQSRQPVAVERQRADGAIIELVYSPHRAEGFTLSVADVTASRRTDDYLRNAQKMEALGQMTGGIAHDFNNFLTLIILNLDFLQNDKGLTDKHARRLRLALDAAFRGSKVVRQLLAFARK
jgi:signal transduction histidine kinase